jgi:hypothetical protein
MVMRRGSDTLDRSGVLYSNYADLWTWTILAVPAPWREAKIFCSGGQLVVLPGFGVVVTNHLSTSLVRFLRKKGDLPNSETAELDILPRQFAVGPLSEEYPALSRTKDRELCPFRIRSAHPRPPRPGPEANQPTGPNLAC